MPRQGHIFCIPKMDLHLTKASLAGMAGRQKVIKKEVVKLRCKAESSGDHQDL